MDYKKLLTKYIQHVSSCEGIDYISLGGDFSDIKFTEEEQKELNELSEATERGFKVEIDPEQDVLGTSKIEVTIDLYKPIVINDDKTHSI